MRWQMFTNKSIRERSGKSIQTIYDKTGYLARVLILICYIRIVQTQNKTIQQQR